DTRAHRVNAWLSRADGDFRALTGLACDRAHLHDAVRYFRHFKFQQPQQHLLVLAADENLRALRAALDFVDEHPQTLIAAEEFALNLLFLGQDGLRLVAERERRMLGSDILNNADDEFALTLGVVRIQMVALRLADALQNNLLGGLRRNAPEVSRRDVHAHDTADHGFGVVLSRFLQRNLQAFVFDDLYRLLLGENARVAGIRVERRHQVRSAAEVT